MKNEIDFIESVLEESTATIHRDCSYSMDGSRVEGFQNAKEYEARMRIQSALFRALEDAYAKLEPSI